MWDEQVLLKLKRDFTESEAVQQLLKLLSEREVEIGILKSERDEAIDRAAKVEDEGKPRKAWLKDEVIADMEYHRKRQMEKNRIANK